MPEETTPAVEQGTDPVGGGEPTPSESSTGGTFTETQMREEAEKLAAKRTEQAERQYKKLQREYESFRQERETEDEAATRKAQENTEKQAKELAAVHERRGELIGALIAKGKSMEQAKELADFAGGIGYDDADDAMGKLTERLGVTFDSAANRTAGGGGNPPHADDSEQFSPEAVSRKRADDPVGFLTWFAEHRKEIEAGQRKAGWASGLQPYGGVPSKT